MDDDIPTAPFWPTVLSVRAKTITNYDGIIKEVMAKWKDISELHLNEERQYEDKTFGGEPRHIFYNPSKTATLGQSKKVAADLNVNEIKWQRPYESEMAHEADQWGWLKLQRVERYSHYFLFDDNDKSDDTEEQWAVYREDTTLKDVKQGQLGDCWCVAAMSLIVRDPLHFKKIFVTHDFEKTGAYVLCLCIDGQWQAIIIDDKVPTYNGSILFASAVNKQMWPLLVEKAFAKAYGSYAALATGHPSEGLSALTGEPVESIPLNVLSFRDIDLIWGRLVSLSDQNFLIGALCGKLDDNPQRKQRYKEVGIEHTHVYSVLQFRTEQDDYGLPLELVQLRNPWGVSKWNRQWSDHSENWQEEGCQALKSKLNPTQQNEGIFWMCFADFLGFFRSVDVCKVRPDWHDKRLTSKFYQPPDRTLYLLTFCVDHAMPIEFMLHQTGLRKKKENESVLTHLDLNLFVCSVEPGNEPRPLEIKALSVPSNCESFVFAGGYVLDPGIYALLALSFKVITAPSIISGTDIDVYTISVHFPKPSSIEFYDPIMANNSIISKTLLCYMRQFCKKTKQKVDEKISDVNYFMATKLSGVFLLVMIENLRASPVLVTFKATETQGLMSLRNTFRTQDVIPPLSRQIVQIVVEEESPDMNRNTYIFDRQLTASLSFDAKMATYNPAIPNQYSALFGGEPVQLP